MKEYIKKSNEGPLELSLLVSDSFAIDTLLALTEPAAITLAKEALTVGLYCLAATSDRRDAAALREAMEVASKLHVRSTKQLGAQMESTLDQHRKRIDDHVVLLLGKTGKDGAIGRSIDRVLEGLREQLAALLDPKRADSYIAYLRDALIEASKGGVVGAMEPLLAEVAAIKEQITQVRMAVEVRRAVTQSEAKGTEKGAAFEDWALPVLSAFALPRRDSVEYTGATSGSAGPRTQKGDFVYTIDPRLGGLGLRIGIEAKNSQLKLPKLVAEVRSVKDNREAVVGVGISTNPTLFAPGVSPIQFIDDTVVIVNVPMVADDPAVATMIIETALEVARYLALARRAATPARYDAVNAKRHIEAICERLKALTEAKKRLTHITTIAGEVSQLLSAVQLEVRNELDGLRADFGLGAGEDALAS